MVVLKLLQSLSDIFKYKVKLFYIWLQHIALQQMFLIFSESPLLLLVLLIRHKLKKIINRKEEELERRIGHAWRSKKITREVHDLPLLYTYGWGTPLFLQHRNIYEFSGAEGDKIEIWQGASAAWENILSNSQW